MKNKKLFLLIGLIVLIAGCTYNPPDNSSSDNQGQKEKGTQPQVITFEKSAGEISITRNFYFIFDGSGSMSDRCSGNRKIDGAKESVKRFLKKVPSDVNLGLLIYGNGGQNDCQEVVPIGSNNRAAFEKAITKSSASGGTPLGYAMKFGVDRLVAQYKKQLGYGEYNLVIVTDGEAYEEEILDAVNHASKYPFIMTYTIGLCLDREHTLKQYSRYYRDANDYQSLEKALEEVVGETEVFDPSVFDESLFSE